jgi:Uma2 family endonuclease
MLEADEGKGCGMTAATVDDVPRSPGEVLLDGFMKLQTPEGFTAELIEGEIVVSPPPGGNHETAVWSLMEQVVQRSATRMQFSGQKGLKLERGGLCPKNYVIPDGVFAPYDLDLFADAEPWMPSAGVALVVEVTSSSPERDRGVKRHCYAKARIPLYLLVDREQQSVSLFGEPSGEPGKEDYREETRVGFGKPLDLPEPFSFTLDTTEFR